MSEDEGLKITVVDISADLTEGTLEMRPFPHRFCVNAESLDTIIAVLGKLRGRLVPEPSYEVDAPPGRPLEAPRLLYSLQDAYDDNILVHVRDQRFGWLHYVIAGALARELGEKLIERADRATPVRRA